MLHVSTALKRTLVKNMNWNEISTEFAAQKSRKKF